MPFPLTAADGMCSYGIGNVGTYNSDFTSTDIASQVFNNPAGRYDYGQLIGQAMNQTYIVTDLFENLDDPSSLFSTFLPGETLPTTEFLSAPPPAEPPTVPPTNPIRGGCMVFSYSLMIVLACSILALLL